MNRLLSTFLLAILIACQPKQNVLEVDIQSVDLSIETPYNIKCEKFYDSFSDEEYVTKKLLNKSELSEFLDALSNLQKEDSIGYLDTRAKIIIKYENSVDTICADQFSMLYKREFLKMSQTMRNILWNLADSSKVNR